MTTPFETVKQYLQQLPVTVVSEDADDQLVVVEAPRQGVHHLVLDCEDDILVIEQVIADFRAAPAIQSLQAVRNGRVHILPDTIYTSQPGPRAGEAMRTLFGHLYPDAEAPDW